MKLKKILLSPALTIIAFLLAAVLLLFSGVGGARAALTYVSETYSTQVKMYQIGVSLLENDQLVSYRNYSGSESTDSWAEGQGRLVQKMLPNGAALKLGEAYDERISAENSGQIGEYVRITLYTYWEQTTDADGNELPEEDYIKRPDLDPSLIDLHVVEGSGWLGDTSANTKERRVFYYNKLLHVNEKTNPLTDTLTINPGIKGKVTTEQVGSITRYKYDYDGVRFVVEARVDAVQENNAQAAILSAWGRNVVVNEDAGTLALVG